MNGLLLECWRSGQIDPAEMVALCRADPALEAALRENEIVMSKDLPA
jgi:hypothetical protein